MSKNTDKEFEDLISEFISNMGKVKTDGADYVSWLQQAIEEIEMAIMAAEGE